MNLKFYRTSIGLSTAVAATLFLNACSDSKSPEVTLKGGTPVTAIGVTSGGGTIDAGAMSFTVYKFAASASADCSNPITIFENSAGVKKDMLAAPTFGTGRLSKGTYPCVMVEVSKVITTAPASTSGSCTKDVEFQDVICNQGQASTLIDGTAVTCSGTAANAQHVVLYITTLSSGTDGNRALLAPINSTDTTSGLKLTSPFVVSASTSATLTVDKRNFLDGSSGTCGTSAPAFGFN